MLLFLLLQVDVSLNGIVNAILGNLGTLVTLLVILYGGYKRWWVFGWYAEELKKRNERLETRLDNLSGESKALTSVAEKAVTVAEQKTEVTNA